MERKRIAEKHSATIVEKRDNDNLPIMIKTTKTLIENGENIITEVSATFLKMSTMTKYALENIEHFSRNTVSLIL